MLVILDQRPRLDACMKTIALGGTSRTVVDYSSQLGQGFESLPYSLRVFGRECRSPSCGRRPCSKVAARNGQAVAFRPSRLLLQDMLGLPILVDLMAMRSALVRSKSPVENRHGLPVGLVIDHSMSVEFWSQPDALERNTAREFEINAERFAFIKACESQFQQSARHSAGRRHHAPGESRILRHRRRHQRGRSIAVDP